MVEEEKELEERVVEVNRVSKVVKGGKRFRFSVVVVVGDGVSRVGVAFGKAHEVSAAVRKGAEKAQRSMKSVKVINGTIPHSIVSKCGGAKLLMKPAAPGTGIIACEPVRAVLELAGVRNVLTKSLGSNTTKNLVKATLYGLLSMQTKEEIEKIRGVQL
ncbi:MAG: 30S ribosomal protein S5 [bacterium (Candidatus Stahlbacteria) CG08_land_8_20_14_0_20_40_26]|nr:MAG: 30S ribosomal protein S5 [bacterium (Candidatus Stahlbacteria) CG23_combo_of_CG06-09_8_20_14_all_40_9]PIS26863.1 MAG: 30S ribosomal protein S5 [bacterium (Candidatus Stahlbacteria) CG08_land_8_20_14_0_20_40_26]